MFTYKTQIFLHHTDAAGRLFFGNLFFLIQEAKESFLEMIGLSISDMLNDPGITFPLVHAEADYKVLLVTGDRITIDVEIEKIGDTSVTFFYTVKKSDGTLAGTARTVTVTVDKKTFKKKTVPADWRAKLESHLKVSR